MYVLIVTAIVMCVLAGIYFYFALKRMIGVWYRKTLNPWIKAVIGGCAVFLAIRCMNPYGTPALVLYHFLMISLACDGIYKLIRIVAKRKQKDLKKWDQIFRCGVIPVALTVALLIYGHWHMLDVKEKKYEVLSEKKLDHSNGYTVAFISDLHFPTTMNAEKLKMYCDTIASEHPDFVILGGDIVDESTKKEEMQQALRLLADIDTAYGVFYVYGNHDCAYYSNTADYTEDDLNRTLAECGIYCLADEVYEIGDDLLLVGRKDEGYGGVFTRMETRQLLADQNLSRFVLLADHQPVELQENAKAGVDLQLSGHTHGGQIWPVGLISDLLGFGELNYGEKQIGPYRVIVSSGMAGWGYSVRTGHDSEYLIIRIEENGKESL